MNYFDLHCDTATECMEKGERLFQNSLQLDLERGNRYTPWVQCFAIWVRDGMRGAEAIAYFDRVLRNFERMCEENHERIQLCRSGEEIREAEKRGCCTAVLTVENGAATGGTLDGLRHLAAGGVKAITLTWNGESDMGDGAGVEHPHGLTSFGREALCEMERLCVLADVSHASDPLFYDVASRSTRPFLATHSNSRAICPHKRNLTDEQFLAIRSCGGVVGLNFVPQFLRRDAENARLEDIIPHVEHFLSLGGERTLSLGCDFDGSPLPPDVHGVESLETLAEEMLCRNYSEALVNAVLFGNAFRFISETAFDKHR